VALTSVLYVDVVYLDYAKAFDSVVHSKLLAKLSHYGASGSVLIWIEKFLINRCQCVRVGNVLSEYADVVSGVVQGSVLGPVLFIVFINDMCNCIPGSTVLKLFANDAKLYTTVSGDGTCGDLQTCLSTVFKWSESQQLRLAPHKCAVMHLKPRRLNSQNDQIYSINNCALPVVDSYKDLGITYDKHLSYTPHVAY